MRYLSLFSGIEAVTCAWEPLGFECVAVAEILEYQSAVLKKHYPNIPNLGDVTKITEEDIKALGHIDIVVFGSPCQDLSIAGKRLGLNAIKEDLNHSSILFFEGVRVFRLAQQHCGARYMLWENVVGALHSKKGEDFGTVLNTLVGFKRGKGGIKWGTEGVVFGEDSMCEWAVLDAQWFGVPQRRRRVFALLDTGNWASRKPILLEAEHLRKITRSPKIKEQKDTQGATPSLGEHSESKAYELHMMDFRVKEEVICPTVTERWGTGGNNVPLILKTYDRQGILQWEDSDTASTISARDWKSATDLVSYEGEDHTYALRRLTPLETERLQGFPDNWTYLPSVSIAKRYNALGRAMAVPVLGWIGKRIKDVTEHPQGKVGKVTWKQKQQQPTEGI